MSRAGGTAALARSRAAGGLAVALAALLLTACTTGRAGSHGAAGHRAAGSAGRNAAGRHRDFVGPRKLPPGARVTIIAGSGSGPGPGFRGVFIAGPGGPGLVIGFGGPGGGNRPQIDVPAIPPANSGQAVALPLDSYEQVATQQQNALTAASDLLTQQCMQAKGFSYPLAAPAITGSLNLQDLEDGYGVASLAQGQTYGYGQPRGAGAGPPLSAFGSVGTFVNALHSHAPAWTSALLGFVPGASRSAAAPEGCLQSTNAEVYGPLGGNPNPDPVPGLAVQAAQWTQSDPRILAVQREWSACMTRHGFAYKTPSAAQDHSWPQAPTSVEISTAVADVQCKAATNLVNTWLAVEAAYQQALIAQNLTGLSRLQASFGTLLQRAEVLLQLPAADGGPGQRSGERPPSLVPRPVTRSPR